ncbi:MAG: hypothetical protein H6735_17610 [Alphaproteobacteria bacterium]|nr:hypothetical protein [Alphaproteobacteria bacterium]
MIAALLAGCIADRSSLVVQVPEEHLELFESYVRHAGHPGLTVEARSRGGARIVLVQDEPGTEAYRIEEGGRQVIVHGSDVLGLEYGLADVLEQLGFRFLHPTHPVVPTALGPLSDVKGGGHVEPRMARRGLHLHTLHPIEAEMDLWEGIEGGDERAHQIVDWIVMNRGNYVQWPMLDDILRFPGLAPDWQEHTAEIVSYAHARGVDVGLGVQLFGSGNLQYAFDLVDDDELDPVEVRRRLELLAPVEPDVISLSFGEFSGEDPQHFIDTGNEAVRLMHEVIDGSEVVTTVHVGNYDDLRIEWNGKEILYYFLGAELDDVTPWIHTVMFYDLYEDAGGAYLHDEFDEHRDYIEERLAAGQPVGYHPESAYWVAFDDSVPNYFPLYQRTRFTDLQRLMDQGLQDHVMFSSGWEWGYWQTDQQVLRWNHTLPDDWTTSVAWTWAPWGDDGAELAAIQVALADLQHEKLIGDRLTAWLAGRDAIIDLGDNTLGILSQPDRPQVNEILRMDASQLAELDAVVAGLTDLADRTQELADRAADLGGTDPWFEEARDGIAIDVLRARFAATVLKGTVALARGQDPSDDLVNATAQIGFAQEVVDRRHQALHWTGGDRIVAPSDDNATIYRYGYLGKVTELCYWQRERILLQNAATPDATEQVPPCT